MKITDVNIPESEISNGLKSIEMRKLGQVVLLAGKNGSGKSRLLNQISRVIKQKPNESAIRDAKDACGYYRNEISKFEDLLFRHGKFGESLGAFRDIEAVKERIKSEEVKIEKRFETLGWEKVVTDKIAKTYRIVNFVPNNLNLSDNNALSKHILLAEAKKVTEIGVDGLSVGTYARIQVIQDRWVETTHQNSKVSPDKQKEIIKEYDKLRELIKIFLDTNLARNSDGDPTIFGFTLGNSKLSDGQKILLQLCLAIHCQQHSLDELILFMDEPENHLHPDIIIKTIEKIIENIPNGQIWISTHSLPVLAYFGPSNIWFMDKGEVSYAGNGPEKVLDSLLGDEERIGKLQDFISLPGIYALHNHAFESLFHPEVVMTGAGDHQTLQINAEITKHLADKDKIRVLDYGAGKGRLIANIAEANSEPLESFYKRFDYIASDKFDSDKAECLSNIHKIYPNPEERYFNSFSDIFGKYDKGSFDVVIMSNVLHEIDPKDWLSLFSKGGDIYEALSENGILLLVEDHVMPIGEKAYQKGFIVLNTSELKDLFKITEGDKDFDFSDARGDGRLKAHRIPKKCLGRIDPDSRKKALASLHKTAGAEILKIRSKDVTYKNGKVHGFWIQQFANTGLALSEF